MKGLVAIPGIPELEGAYESLQTARKGLDCATLARWSQWARFDPRLAEQWVSHVARYWEDIPPLEIRGRLFAEPWPAAGAFLMEQAGAFGSFSSGQLSLYRRWMALVTFGIGRACHEQFFVGLRALGGKAMLEDARFPLKSYRRWGYLGREVLVNKAGSFSNKTSLEAAERRRVLDQLIRDRSRLTTSDYRKALGGLVSARQAELDLGADSRLIARGRTRGRFYLVRVRSSRH